MTTSMKTAVGVTAAEKVSMMGPPVVDAMALV
jgi:hypothetical protein